MAEEIVFFAAKCHKSHLKAQKEAALFLRNLLKLICAGATCKNQNSPPPLPCRRVSGLCEGQNRGWGIWAPGLPSLNPPVEKTGEEKENPAGCRPPGGSREHAGGSGPPPPISQTDRAEKASSPRPRCRAGPPRPGAAGKRRLTGCPSILVELVRAAPSACTARGPATWALEAPRTGIPGPNPQENYRVAPGPGTRPAG